MVDPERLEDEANAEHTRLVGLVTALVAALPAEQAVRGIRHGKCVAALPAEQAVRGIRHGKCVACDTDWNRREGAYVHEASCPLVALLDWYDEREG